MYEIQWADGRKQTLATPEEVVAALRRERPDAATLDDAFTGHVRQLWPRGFIPFFEYRRGRGDTRDSIGHTVAWVYRTP